MNLAFNLRHMRALLASGLLFTALPAFAETVDEPALFEEAVLFSQPEISGNALRSRSVIITNDAFTGARTLQNRSSGEPSATDSRVPPVKSLRLNLFEDVVVDVDLTNAYKNRSGSQTWVGKVEAGSIAGTAAFVIRDGQVFGTVGVPGKGKYSIRPGVFNSHIIEQIDGSKILTGETDAVIPKLGGLQKRGSLGSDDPQAAGAAIEVSNDDGSIIDVYVGYSNGVDPTVARDLAELGIGYANQAYENSGINQRVWLVGDVDPINYNTTAAVISSNDDPTDPDVIAAANLVAEEADLNAAKDGLVQGLPELHDKRDEHHADLVMLLRPHATGDRGCTGLGFLQATNGDPAFEASAFSVMQACSFGDSVFAHELGHNMGSQHDWFMQDSVQPSSFAHGYIDTNKKFRTIMAYNNRCSVLFDGDCPTIAQFSNPNITHEDAPTGVAANTSTACSAGDPSPSIECDADNATNFNEKAEITSQFRDSKIVWTGAVNADWNNAGNWTPSQAPRSYDNVLIPGARPNYPTINGTAEARELTIENGAELNMTGGTLAVGWAWEDAGGFNATGGKVVLAGPIGITVTSSSTFNDLEIGTGSDTTKATADSKLNVTGNFTLKGGANFTAAEDVDINGNFTIDGGAGFIAGDHQLNLAGDFNDNARGFIAGTGTIVFDGTATQSVDQTTAFDLINEDISGADGRSPSLVGIPSGWVSSPIANSEGFLALQFDDAASGELVSFPSPDNWLITSAVTLAEGASYVLTFDYRELNVGAGDTLDIEAFTVHYGTSQSAGEMTNDLLSIPNSSFTNALQTAEHTFQVPADGVYYIGFNVKNPSSGAAYTALDNIKLDGVSITKFGSIQVASGETEFKKPFEMTGDLSVSAGAVVNLGSNIATVEGDVTNNGEIKQMLTAPAGVKTAFSSFKNKDGSEEKYVGVLLTPAAAANNVEVSVKGQECDTGFVKRCYTITSGSTVTVDAEFPHDAGELNGNVLPVLKRLVGTDWLEVPGNGTAMQLVTGELVDLGLEDSEELGPFPPAEGVPGEMVVSESKTLAGISPSSLISVSNGGEYSLDGGVNFTSANGTVDATDIVSVRNIAGPSVGDVVLTELTVGAKIVSFIVTTVAADIDPDPFSFEPVVDVAKGVAQTSEIITITGINTDAPISVSGGDSAYRVNDIGNPNGFTNAPGFVKEGDQVTVRHTSSVNFSDPVITTLTIGGETGEFKSTTLAEDTIPEPIVMDPATLSNVDLGDPQTSSTTITGINAPTDIAISGGQYSLDNGVNFTSLAGTVNDGDIVIVKHISSAFYGGSVDTVLTVGTAEMNLGTFTSTTKPFEFLDQAVTDAPLGEYVSFTTLTLDDINPGTVISIENGEYRINGTGVFVETDGTVTDGDVVEVRHASSASPASPTITELTIGTVTHKFESTTTGPDTVPDQFDLVDVSGVVAINSPQVSNAIEVTGINAPSPISVSSGSSYQIDGDGTGDFITDAGMVNNGQKVIVKHTSSGDFETPVTTTLNIGGVTDTFTSTTEAKDTDPVPFSFTDKSGVEINTPQPSNSIDVSGINAPAPISVSAGGSYQITNADGTINDFTSDAGTVVAGDKVIVQHTSSGNFETPVTTTLTIGSESGSFKSTTRAVNPANSFAFVDTVGTAGSTQTSNSIIVSGLDIATAITVSGDGSYSVNGGAFTTATGTEVSNDDVVVLQHTLATGDGSLTETTLSIGVTVDTYTSTTVAASDITPTAAATAFPSPASESIAAGGSVVSPSYTVAGVNGSIAPISISNGEYSINGGAFTTEPGNVTNGDVVRVRHIASTVPGGVVTTNLQLGAVSTNFVSKTTESIEGNGTSGGGSMGAIGLMFLSMFTLLCATRRRRLVKGINL